MHRSVPWLATAALALLLAACQAPRADGALAATVGLDPDVCATESTLTLDASEAPHTVYVCYTITNTGDRSIGTHDLSDGANGTIWRGFAASLGAGASVDTVAAGEVLAVEVSGDTTFEAVWDGYVGTTRVASAEASAQVVYEAPLAYAAIVGTFTAASNAATVAPYAGNVVVLGARTLEGEPLDAPLVVTVTPPGLPAFEYTIDPEFALDGVVVLFWDDFSVGLASSGAAARLEAAGFATDRVAPTAAIGASDALEGDWTFAFPGATLVRAADPTDTVAVPEVSAVDPSLDRTAVSVAFESDADATYELEAYGRGDAAVFGFASGDASPVDVALSGALEVGEEVGVDVFAIRGALDPDAVFADGARFDLAEYLFVGPTTEDVP